MNQLCRVCQYCSSKVVNLAIRLLCISCRLTDFLDSVLYQCVFNLYRTFQYNSQTNSTMLSASVVAVWYYFTLSIHNHVDT